MSALPDDVVADYIAAIRLADASGDTDLGTRLTTHMFTANENADKAAWRPVPSQPVASVGGVLYAPAYYPNTC